MPLFWCLRPILLKRQTHHHGAHQLSSLYESDDFIDDGRGSCHNKFRGPAHHSFGGCTVGARLCYSHSGRYQVCSQVVSGSGAHLHSGSPHRPWHRRQEQQPPRGIPRTVSLVGRDPVVGMGLQRRRRLPKGVGILSLRFTLLSSLHLLQDQSFINRLM